MIKHRISWLSASSLLLLLAVPALSYTQNGKKSDDYVQTNLVSDIPGVALNTDANLVNPWGLAYGPTSPFWVANNGTGTSTLYDGDGEPVPNAKSPLVVTIEALPGEKQAAPTGLVFNPTSKFVVQSGMKSAPAIFLFATENGTINGWNPTVSATVAVLAVNRSSVGAIYKGLALGRKDHHVFLFATDFHNAAIDVFDRDFDLVKTEGGFIDPQIPAGFAPFGIHNIHGKLWVTYAKQDANKEDDVPGPGNGYVDVFDTAGNLLRRFASQGPLNSPWGIAVAPAEFGRFSYHVLIGNFGDGRINAFDYNDGDFDGPLENVRERPITISGLWALDFGNGNRAGSPNTLFFTAGLADEEHGLFGKIRPQQKHY